jgi:serine/threonine protein kinase
MTEETIFAEALEKSTPAERAAYLDEACAGDAVLRQRVETLLKSHEAGGSFLGKPAIQCAAEELAGRACVEDTQAERPADDGGVEALDFLAPSDKPDSLGRIGHYEVLEVLGKGGFGIVFRAFDDVLQRVVAVKVLAPQMAATSPARKRFLREARAAAAVKHDNVVQIHATEEQPLPYLVMEYVPGETLQQRLDRIGPLEVAEVVRIGRQIAEGLAAAHANDLIHRDVKPANVLIESGPQGRAKLTDFGLARTADDASISQSGVVAGTPMYMAPEQAKAESLDHRADLFSLGSVLYAMLTGRPPFRASTTLAVLKRVAEDTPRPIREVIPEVSEWLCRVVEKLHAKDPAERFPSAREVADLLADCEAQLKAHGMLKDYSRIPGGTPADPPRWARRWLWGAAALLLLALGATAWGVFTWSQSTPTGVVHVNVYEVNLKVTIDNREVLLDDDDDRPILWYEIDGEEVGERTRRGDIKLAPGEHRLRVFKHDKLIHEETFTLAPGETKTIDTPRPKRPPPDADWVLLFNEKDLTGWLGDTRLCRVEKETLIAPPNDQGLSLRSERRDFKNFVLRFEHQVEPAGDSVPVLDVLLHGAPLDDPGKQKRQAVVRFAADGASACGLTGSPFQIEKDLQRWKGAPFHPPEKWNKFEIRSDQGRIEVFANGKSVATFSAPETRAGQIGLQVQKGKWSFRNIAVRELPPVPVTGLPFVVLARDGQAERPCATLREAITAASSGDTIEIRSDGPFLVQPLVARGKALTIRAAAGRRPVLRLDERTFRLGGQRWFLLESDAPLVLEGLELQHDRNRSVRGSHTGVVYTSEGPLVMANCRLMVAGYSHAVEVHNSRPSQFRNCEFIVGGQSKGPEQEQGPGYTWSALMCYGAGGVVVDQCVLTRPLRVNLETMELPKAGTPIRISRSTLFGLALMVKRHQRITAADLDAAKSDRVQIHLEENVLAGPLLNLYDESGAGEALTRAEAQAFLRRLITWSEGHNAVSDASAPMTYYGYWGDPAPRATLLRDGPTPADWQQFWKLERATGSWGRIYFQTESLSEKVIEAPQTVSAPDFRLRGDSLGKKAGPGGKDLGADLDRIGPGKAYEEWKKTDEYRAWRSQVEDLMAQQ